MKTKTQIGVPFRNFFTMPAGSNNKEKLLSVMFVLLNQGIEEPTKDRVQKMAQISSATFPSLISRVIKKEGTIEYGNGSGTLKLTNKGKDVASELTPPGDLVTNNTAVHENIKKQLKGKALKIFEFLADGEEYDKKIVMKEVDCMNPKTFAPIMSRELKSKGFIEYPTKTTVKLTKEMCFPFDD